MQTRYSEGGKKIGNENNSRGILTGVGNDLQDDQKEQNGHSRRTRKNSVAVGGGGDAAPRRPSRRLHGGRGVVSARTLYGGPSGGHRDWSATRNERKGTVVF